MNSISRNFESVQPFDQLDQFIPAVRIVALSLVSTLILLYAISKETERKGRFKNNLPRSTPLPGFGILGDRVNEFVSIFLDALAIYVHNDTGWDCQRRLLCEANQRAQEYGIFHGILMYLTSLSVSFWLRGQRVSESMEAMRRGRQGLDCVQTYPRCPFRL